MWIKIALAITLFAEPCAAQEDRSWHLFSQSRGGTISLLHGLTKEECEFASNRALGLPATQKEREAEKEAKEKWRAEYEKAARNNPKFQTCINAGLDCGPVSRALTQALQMGTVGPGDIKTAECFQ